MSKTHMTVGEVATTFNIPTWKARRAIDSLGVEIPRAGLFRLFPRSLLAELAINLRDRGWLPVEQEVPA